VGLLQAIGELRVIWSPIFMLSGWGIEIKNMAVRDGFRA
jgi:hypothetical protein